MDCFASLAKMGWTAPDGIDVPDWCCRFDQTREPSMTKISTIGLDLAKNVFQLHGVDASGAVVLKKQLRRGAIEKFLHNCHPAWWAWKPAAAPIIGHG